MRQFWDKIKVWIFCSGGILIEIVIIRNSHYHMVDRWVTVSASVEYNFIRDYYVITPTNKIFKKKKNWSTRRQKKNSQYSALVNKLSPFSLYTKGR